MPKCLVCAKKGLFLKLTNGLCPQCLETAQRQIIAANTASATVSTPLIQSNAHTPAKVSPPKDASSFAAEELTPAEKALLSEISRINARGGELTNDLYQQLRAFEMNWLERNYDFSTIEGIMGIPVSNSIPGAPSPSGPIKGHTGEVYYYLRHKSYKYEEAGEQDLALACMCKSVDLVMCRNYYSAEDCYPLVKMLARFGHIDDAYKAKRKIDKALGIPNSDDSIIKAEIKRRQELLDFEWLKANLPDKCPKSISGYRRMKTQNTKNYQLLQQLAADLGRAL